MIKTYKLIRNKNFIIIEERLKKPCLSNGNVTLVDYEPRKTLSLARIKTIRKTYIKVNK